MRKFIFAVVVLLLSSSLAWAGNSPEVERAEQQMFLAWTTEYLVASIVDGDTFWAIDRHRNFIKFRLRYVDAPEHGQPDGIRAKKALTKLMPPGSIVYLTDSEEDQYGRGLVEAYTKDRKFINEEMVRLGYAWVYTKYCNRVELCKRLKAVEIDAQNHARGLWGDEWAEAPWKWRYRHKMQTKY